MNTKKVQTSKVSFRLTDDQKRSLIEQAREIDVTPSEYIRLLINKMEFISN